MVHIILSCLKTEDWPIVYGAYHFVFCLKGLNNSVAYSLKYRMDLMLSAKSNSCFI